jgi:hypothetical protein
MVKWRHYGPVWHSSALLVKLFKKNSFMSNFLGEAELFWKKKLFGKIVSQTASCMNERKIRERARISYFFHFHPNSCLCENECLAKKKTKAVVSSDRPYILSVCLAMPDILA